MIALCKKKGKAQARVQQNAAWKKFQAALASNLARQAGNASAGNRCVAFGKFA
jgi:hypothetical protein